MIAKKPSKGIRVKKWWALLRGPGELPVCFPSKRDALWNRDTDEYLVQIFAVPARVKDRAK